MLRVCECVETHCGYSFYGSNFNLYIRALEMITPFRQQLPLQKCTPKESLATWAGRYAYECSLADTLHHCNHWKSWEGEDGVLSPGSEVTASGDGSETQCKGPRMEYLVSIHLTKCMGPVQQLRETLSHIGTNLLIIQPSNLLCQLSQTQSGSFMESVWKCKFQTHKSI